MQLNDKCVIVTGAGSGIGRASARAIAAAGGRLMISDINAERLAETADSIRAANGEVCEFAGNVTDPWHAQMLVDTAVKLYGRLDGAFNNAGIEGCLAPISESEESDWDRVIETNLKGVWLNLRAQIRQMTRQSGPASIVNTSSVGGLVGVPGNAGYSAAKHGVIGLTRSVALECASVGIRVNAICPGATKSPMFERVCAAMPEFEMSAVKHAPMQRMATPEEIVGMVVFLLSEQASFLTGQAIAIDGGVTSI